MRKEQIDAVPEGCCIKCYYAKNKPCRCGCGGEFHGLGFDALKQNKQEILLNEK